MENNICLMTDSYKLTHHKMYPKGIEVVYSYFESRDGAEFPSTVFFGLQYLIKEYLLGKVVTTAMVDEAEAFAAKHFGNPNIFCRSRWDYIIEKYNGCLPVRIKAVPEGTVVPVSNVLMTIENTDLQCSWLTNHLETLLCHLWSSCTTATLSREIKKCIKYYLELTSDSLDGLDYMLHDFGYRGVSSVESAGIQGAAHLINFKGTDTIRAMEIARDYYGASLDSLAFSVPATEHSIMTSYGQAGEIQLFDELLRAYPTGILSVVIDSYNYGEFIDKICRGYRDEIINRQGTIVFRPDSGDPQQITLDVLSRLYIYFSPYIKQNSKGYKVLPPQLKVLWGDGIDGDDVDNILNYCRRHGWSASNMVFGMGGGLLQKINRDTQGFAFKCSAQKVNGHWQDVKKNPVDGKKASKAGKLALVDINHKMVTVSESSLRAGEVDILRPVFENGRLLVDDNFDIIRARAALQK